MHREELKLESSESAKLDSPDSSSQELQRFESSESSELHFFNFFSTQLIGGSTLAVCFFSCCVMFVSELVK